MSNYFQQQQPRFNTFPPVVKNLLIANILAFIATYILKNQNIDLVDLFGLHYFESPKFKVSQVITSMFLHGGFTHILFNMYGLWMFGQMIENYYGAKKFLILYFVAGIGASIIQEASLWVYFHHIQDAISVFNTSPTINNFNFIVSKYFSDVRGYSAPQSVEETKGLLESLYQVVIDSSVTIGASGALFGVLVAFGVIYSEVQLFIMFIPIPIKAKYAIIGYVLIELFSGLNNSTGDTVAHFAHLGGALFGFILVMYWRRKARIY